uniref:60 kDa chaperonin 1-like isoform X6 n=1 Tax=Dermatophagoides pteronyssinus TaxID=6956 RepID=A0A6P6XZL5_DERPT|nr:60 kDa chaperonin 1-like isoform X6 [Dermatophagoides pteronyssinus]
MKFIIIASFFVLGVANIIEANNGENQRTLESPCLSPLGLGGVGLNLPGLEAGLGGLGLPGVGAGLPGLNGLGLPGVGAGLPGLNGLGLPGVGAGLPGFVDPTLPIFRKDQQQAATTK